jgi:hypothetical protein
VSIALGGRRAAGTIGSVVRRPLAATLASLLAFAPGTPAVAHAARGPEPAGSSRRSSAALPPEPVVLSPGVGNALKRVPAREPATAVVRQAYDSLPLLFVENRGQLDPRIRFYEQTRDHVALFAAEGVWLSLLSHTDSGRRTSQTVRISAVGGNATPEIVPEMLQEARVNSFHGDDPEQWRADLPTYAAVRYAEVFPGVDLRFYGRGRDLEYDVIVRAGADPSAVRLGLRGIAGLSLTDDGRLRMALPDGRELLQKAPYLYQEIDGRKVAVDGRFDIQGTSPGGPRDETFVYGFEVGDYDRRHDLVIDPTLYYSSYLGGAGNDSGLSINVRPGGTLFVVGSTLSANFDTKLPFDATANGSTDAFVSKFNVRASGAASLVWSTYLGGASPDRATGVEVNAAGEIVVTGTTESAAFPTTAGAYDTSYNGGPGDVFVTKLNAAGSALTYSSYVGGTGADDQRDMALDSAGRVYLTGRTTTAGGPGGGDAYAVKFNPAGGGAADLVWYFFLGGTGNDEGNGIEVTPGGIAYVTGMTDSTDFPITAGAFDNSNNGGAANPDAFLTVMNAAGTAPTYSTFLGRNGSTIGRSVTIDQNGNAYIAGETSSNNFPATAGAFDTSQNGGLDAFVAKFNPAAAGAASLVYATLLGGAADDAALGIAYDGAGGACVTGYTVSANFPLVNALQGTNGGGRDVFITHLNSTGTALRFSTYVGGTADDTANGVDMVSNLCCITGVTASANYDVTGTPFQAGNDGGTDVCLTCISQLTTAVELMSFEAAARDGAAELSWQTGSELNNLGFHVYRSLAADGPYERITSAVIPGLGSSPAGASYRYVDGGLLNGTTYYYKLEDIETTGVTRRHGPVWVVPLPGPPAAGGGDAGTSSTTRVAYGRPAAPSLRVLERTEQHAVLELVTTGFYAVRQPDGTVVLDVPGLEQALDAGLPALPVRHALVDAVVGRRVRLADVTARRVVSYAGLVPALAGTPQMVGDGPDVVRADLRRGGSALGLGPGVFPASAARLVGTAFQGELKKALVDLWPLRWNASTRRVELARRLLVRLEFTGREAGEVARGGLTRGRRLPRRGGEDTLLASLVARARGLYAVRFEDLFPAGGRRVPVGQLRLSRQGEPVPFHLEGADAYFVPGSVLYFFSEGASLNPYGTEAVYELGLSRNGGVAMPLASAFPSGDALSAAWALGRWQQDKTFQPGLLEAPDVWLWESFTAPATKTHTFDLPALVTTSEPSRLDVFLQGGSDDPVETDHHVRLRVNGTDVGETTWDGMAANAVSVPVAAGLLAETGNVLAVESVGDAGAAYSLSFLDRFAVAYPRSLAAAAGAFEGGFSRGGTAEVSGLPPDSLLLDVTSPTAPVWLFAASPTASGIAFRAEADRRYLALSRPSLLSPEVRLPLRSTLRSTTNRADYLLVAPRALLSAAQPLLDLRASQGLAVKAAALDEVFQEFGHGETTPHAIREFIAYGYHFWQAPSPRYVVLLGDASYDYKNAVGGGAANVLPALLVKTSFLWTASDPALAAVNGEDAMPDLALGRLPAANLAEAQAMVDKIVAFETGGFTLADGPAVLVADDPDPAGDFEASAEQAETLLAPAHTVQKVFVSELGAATRPAIAAAFDGGASLVSYLGHGGIAVWASENVFNNQDVASLAPQARQPLVITMDCLSGYFHFPPLNALAEELLKAPDKGAIASFAPSGLSLHEPAEVFHRALLQQLTSAAHERLGEAVFAAQVDYAASGAFPELLSIYNLLGDPALKIR